MQALNTKGSSDNEYLSEITDMNFAFTEFFREWSESENPNKASKWIEGTYFEALVPVDKDISPQGALKQIHFALPPEGGKNFLSALGGFFDEGLKKGIPTIKDDKIEYLAMTPEMIRTILYIARKNKYYELGAIIAKRLPKITNPEIRSILLSDGIHFLAENPNPSKQLLNAFGKADGNTEILPQLIVAMMCIYKDKTNAVIRLNQGLGWRLRGQLRNIHSQQPDKYAQFLKAMKDLGGIPTQIQSIINSV